MNGCFKFLDALKEFKRKQCVKRCYLIILLMNIFSMISQSQEVEDGQIYEHVKNYRINNQISFQQLQRPK